MNSGTSLFLPAYATKDFRDVELLVDKVALKVTCERKNNSTLEEDVAFFDKEVRRDFEAFRLKLLKRTDTDLWPTYLQFYFVTPAQAEKDQTDLLAWSHIKKLVNMAMKVLSLRLQGHLLVNLGPKDIRRYCCELGGNAILTYRISLEDGSNSLDAIRTTRQVLVQQLYDLSVQLGCEDDETDEDALYSFDIPEFWEDHVQYSILEGIGSSIVRDPPISRWKVNSSTDPKDEEKAKQAAEHFAALQQKITESKEATEKQAALNKEAIEAARKALEAKKKLKKDEKDEKDEDEDGKKGGGKGGKRPANGEPDDAPKPKKRVLRDSTQKQTQEVMAKAAAKKLRKRGGGAGSGSQRDSQRGSQAPETQEGDDPMEGIEDDPLPEEEEDAPGSVERFKSIEEVEADEAERINLSDPWTWERMPFSIEKTSFDRTINEYLHFHENYRLAIMRNLVKGWFLQKRLSEKSKLGATAWAELMTIMGQSEWLASDIRALINGDGDTKRKTMLRNSQVHALPERNLFDDPAAAVAAGYDGYCMPRKLPIPGSTPLVIKLWIIDPDAVDPLLTVSRLRLRADDNGIDLIHGIRDEVAILEEYSLDQIVSFIWDKYDRMPRSICGFETLVTDLTVDKGYQLLPIVGSTKFDEWIQKVTRLTGGQYAGADIWMRVELLRLASGSDTPVMSNYYHQWNYANLADWMAVPDHVKRLSGTIPGLSYTQLDTLPAVTRKMRKDARKENGLDLDDEPNTGTGGGRSSATPGRTPGRTSGRKTRAPARKAAAPAKQKLTAAQKEAAKAAKEEADRQKKEADKKRKEEEKKRKEEEKEAEKARKAELKELQKQANKAEKEAEKRRLLQEKADADAKELKARIEALKNATPKK
ncbi:hypothetical protein BJ508DRAFT_315114 [Ascobolus immersus RN42]|uniref:Uncharacterized protein n=1 Tax=Ascobolus immersus RN42 TaxID=1160509 RepID=A0A3N4HC99_ASCIM|nr:hypothetical protein BJ508DRAFT_315114 [Ascobolus immersus RN42]